MTKNHNNYLDLAFQLAEINLGQTGLNPSVGCVIVKDNTIISSGVTSTNGRPHSEFNALNKLNNCSGASLYSTLEPCAHHGKTPPCVNIIIKKKIKEVFYAFHDPDIRTYKKSKKILNKNGIKVKLLNSNNYNNFYKGYFLNKKRSIPLVSAKIAISKDYQTINKKNQWITNRYSRQLVHLLRYKYDCILSTAKSINLDNSLLNCRINGLTNNKPDLFIIDLNLKLKKKLLINSFLNRRNIFLVTLKSNSNKVTTFKKKGYKIIFINSLNTKEDFNLFCRKVYKLGYSRLLVETGLTFLNYLLKNKLLNELYIFQSNNNLGKCGTNNDTNSYLKKISSKLLTINLNDDKLFKKEF